MKDFSFTKVYSSLKSKGSECDYCKTLEILKYKSCKDMCLADSIREQLLVAENIKKTLKRPISSYILKIFENNHTKVLERINTLESNINNLQNTYENISNLSKHPLEPSQDPGFLAKLKTVEERLDKLEHILNTQAADIYELKEEVEILEIPYNNNPISDLIVVYKEEITKNQKIINETKWENDQMKLDIFKCKKKQINWIQNLKKLMEGEVYSNKSRNKNIEIIIEKIEFQYKGIYDRNRLEINAIKGLKHEIYMIIDQQRLLDMLNIDQLIQISKDVFSSYRSMKNIKEKSINIVKKYIEKIKKIPKLAEMIKQIQDLVASNSK